MSRQHHGRRRRTHRRTKQPEPDLVGHIRSALQSDHPIDLLMLASQLVEVMTPRPADQFPGADPKRPPMDMTVAALVEDETPEATALLTAILPMVPSPSLAAEVHAELERRGPPRPSWVAELGGFEIVGTAQMSHILGDGDNVFVSARWPFGSELTLSVYIDHNMGTVVKDAVAAPTSLQWMVDLAERGGDPGTTIAAIDPAEARAKVKNGIGEGDRIFPPLDTDTWPACRPLVEWIVGRLPEGGTGFERPEWTRAERSDLVTRFLASAPGRPLATDPDTADIADTLVWFACDYGPGDPLRWSPVSVEIVMTDWFPRKVVADRQYFAMMPTVLDAFIRFAHAERSIPAELTTETCGAVGYWEREYRRAAAQPHPVLGPMASSNPGMPDLDLIEILSREPGWYEESILADLAEEVGGADVLDSLDTEPLPEEEFDWSGIPDDVHDRVAETLAIADRCCEEWLDTEYRTIARRVLALAARNEPNTFRRKARTDYGAGALVWMVGRASNFFPDRMMVKDFAARLGVPQTALRQRATTLKRATGIGNPNVAHHLEDPRLLHSDRRRNIIEQRNRYREQLKQARS